MSNSPSTFRGETGRISGIEWDDAASLHRSNDGGGVLAEFKAVRHGTLVDLVRFVMSLPREERSGYAIEKAGDHRMHYPEIEALASRADYPPA